MSGALGLRFRDLVAQCRMNTLEPVPRIWEAGILLEILSNLVANQIGVNNKKHCGQECLALPVLAAEDVLRPQHQHCSECDSDAEGDFLAPPVSSHEEGDRGHRDHGGNEPKARSHRC